MEKTDKDHVILTNREIKKLFRKATDFCTWSEFEKGYEIRNRNAIQGVDFFLDRLHRQRKSIGKGTTIKTVSITALTSAIRKVIDESYLFYFNVNGTFRSHKENRKERNKVADKLYLSFIKSL